MFPLHVHSNFRISLCCSQWSGCAAVGCLSLDCHCAGSSECACACSRSSPAGCHVDRPDGVVCRFPWRRIAALAVSPSFRHPSTTKAKEGKVDQSNEAKMRRQAAHSTMRRHGAFTVMTQHDNQISVNAMHTIRRSASAHCTAGGAAEQRRLTATTGLEWLPARLSEWCELPSEDRRTERQHTRARVE